VSDPTLRQMARRTALDAQSTVRIARAERDRRQGALAVPVASALAEGRAGGNLRAAGWPGAPRTDLRRGPVPAGSGRAVPRPIRMREAKRLRQVASARAYESAQTHESRREPPPLVSYVRRVCLGVALRSAEVLA
jgi:hypothetical protein